MRWDELIDNREVSGPPNDLEKQRRDLTRRDARARPVSARELLWARSDERDGLTPEERAELDRVFGEEHRDEDEMASRDEPETEDNDDEDNDEEDES